VQSYAKALELTKGGVLKIVSKVQGFKGSRVQKFKSSKVQRFKGSKVQGLNLIFT
jgi:hypothetical protein